MLTAFIIFMSIATVFAVGTLVFVPTDLIFEKRRKKEAVCEGEAPIEESEPEEAEKITPEQIPFVIASTLDEVDAELADELISDADAASIVKLEDGAGEGAKTYINIGVINENFSAGDTVTLAALKEKGLIDKKIKRLKVLADGTLNKPLTVKAENFSIQAVKMIELTGGTVVVLR